MNRQINGHTLDIFDFLGIKPDQEFYLMNKKGEIDKKHIYTFTKDFHRYKKDRNLYWQLACSEVELSDILTGVVKIIPIVNESKLSVNEIIIIQFARLAGFEWIWYDNFIGEICFSKVPWYSAKPEDILHLEDIPYSAAFENPIYIKK